MANPLTLSPPSGWTCTDPRFRGVPFIRHGGPLNDAMAEMIAHLEFTTLAYQTVDWCSYASVLDSAQTWPGRTEDTPGVHAGRIAHWHGEAAAILRAAILRAGRLGPITPETVKRTLEWRLHYLRREFMIMCPGRWAQEEARALATTARLTFGGGRGKPVRWYAVRLPQESGA